MYYLIDYDSLDVLFQHTKKTVLKAYVKDNGLTLATEIVGNAEDIVQCLTRNEITVIYENITLENLPSKHTVTQMGELLFTAIADETYPEPSGKAAPVEEAVKPEPKSKPQTTKPATDNKVSAISAKALQNSTIGLGSEPPVKRIHKQICETISSMVENTGIEYSLLIQELVFDLDKTEKLLKGYVTDGIRRNILTMENYDEL